MSVYTQILLFNIPKTLLNPSDQTSGMQEKPEKDTRTKRISKFWQSLLHQWNAGGVLYYLICGLFGGVFLFYLELGLKNTQRKLGGFFVFGFGFLLNSIKSTELLVTLLATS